MLQANLQIGKLYRPPFDWRCDNANIKARERCDEIIGIETNSLHEAEEYDRLRLIHINSIDIVMILEVDPSRKYHPGSDGRSKQHYVYLKLLLKEKVVEVYALDGWINGFVRLDNAI